jgi:hypothetical protein
MAMIVMPGTVRRHAGPMPIPDRASAVVIPVLREGILAEEFCRNATRADVAAVFERCIYLRAGERFICIGEPAIGNGPLTMIVDLGDFCRLRERRLRAGQSAFISDQCIAIGDAVRFDIDRCAPWRAPHWPQRQPSVVLSDVGDAIVRWVDAEAPADGLGRLLGSRGPGVTETPFARIARPRMARFADWLRTVLDTPRCVPDASPVRDLIGVGPGLTPSGDDFLSGALVTLDALAERNARAALARAIGDAPSGLTSPLSGCLLRAAAAGHASEALGCAVSSAIGGEPGAAVAALRQAGHSSGWDMLAGIATALAAMAAARF